MKVLSDEEAVLLGAKIFDGRYRNFLPEHEELEENDSVYHLFELMKRRDGKPVYSVELILVTAAGFAHASCLRPDGNRISRHLTDLYKRLVL